MNECVRDQGGHEDVVSKFIGVFSFVGSTCTLRIIHIFFAVFLPIEQDKPGTWA